MFLALPTGSALPPGPVTVYSMLFSRLLFSSRHQASRCAATVVLAVAGLVVSTGCSGPDGEQLLASGQAMLASGDYPSAAIQFRAALQANPDLHAARAAHGAVLLAQGDARAAVVELERVVSSAPETPGAIAGYAKALVESANEKRTIQALSALKPALASDRAVVLSYLAYTWSVLDDDKKAEEALRQALSADPKHPLALTFDARRAWSQGRKVDAQRQIEAALLAAPEDKEALHFKGYLLEVEGDRKSAIEIWKRSAQGLPVHVASHESLISAFLSTKDVAKARSQLETLTKLAAWHPGVRLAEARILIAEGELERAREPVLRLLAAAPEHAGLLAMAGFIESRIGSPIQAAAHYRKLLSVNPDIARVRLELAQVEVLLGQYSDAAVTLKPLLRGSQVSSEVLALASDIEMRQGNFAAADELLRRATIAAPDDSRLQAAGLVRRMRLGDVEQPLQELEQLAASSRELYAEEALFTARMALGDFEGAFKALDQMEKKSPGKSRTHELRARVHMARRDLPAARKAFEEAHARDGRDFGVVAALAVIDQLENKPEQAIARVQAVVNKNPDQWAAMVLLSELSLGNGGSVEQSLELLKKAIKASPLTAEPRLKLIELSLRRRLFKDALAYSRDALAALPNDERLLDATGRAQFLSGDVEQAASTFRSLVNLVPKSAAPLVELARIYDTQGRRDSALSTLQRAVEVEPSNESVQNAYVQLLVDSRQTNQALAHARRQRELRPKEPLPYVLLASVQERTRDTAAAAETLRDGLAKTQRPELARRLFVLLVRTGKVNEARSFATQWMQRNPQDQVFEYSLAELEISEGALKSAEERLRRVVSRYPGDVLALNNLAWLAARRGDTESVKLARRAVGISPDRPDLLDTLAFALSVSGKHQDALAIQRRAIELAPDAPLFRLGLAKVALAAGDKSLARSEVAALKALDPSFGATKPVKDLEAKL